MKLNKLTTGIIFITSKLINSGRSMLKAVVLIIPSGFLH